MTPERFSECLKILGLSMRKLAEILDTHSTTIQRWSKGQQPIPENLEEWLEKQTEARTAYPLPKDWERNKTR